MKRIHFILALIAAFTTSDILASALDGLWQSQLSNQTIRVRQVQDGIKVQSAGRGDWNFYRTSNDGYTFIDRNGGRFYFYNYDGVLEWKERSYSNGVPFVRINGGSYYGNNDWDDNWYEDDWDDHYYNEHHYDDFSNLYGNWRSFDSGDQMYIKYAKSGLLAKVNGRSWNKFRRTGGNKFKDRNGNAIKILDRNRLQWKSHCGRYRIIYERDNNRRPRNNRGSCGRRY